MTKREDELDRLRGTLIGTAIGDALGLVAEGMSAIAITRRFGVVDRFCLLGDTGFVSDDTEQAALVAQAILRSPNEAEACGQAFRRSMLGWFCRLPFGVGFGTVRACLRMALRRVPSGVMSAGNGAAMRAAILGVYFHDRPAERALFGRQIAEVTHRDPRAVEGALYVAELAAECASDVQDRPVRDRHMRARRIVTEPELGAALDRARELADSGADILEAARVCGTTGYVVSSLALSTYVFLMWSKSPMDALSTIISAGGDTDSNGAIVGGWLGALHGERGLPTGLISRIHDGPFGPSHLRKLADALQKMRDGEPVDVPEFSVGAAMARNVALFPVILGHGLRRVLPF